jgi:hypothetical protein
MGSKKKKKEKDVCPLSLSVVCGKIRVLLADAKDPKTATLVLRILPEGSHASLHQVIGRFGFQLLDRGQVIVAVPKILVHEVNKQEEE